MNVGTAFVFIAVILAAVELVCDYQVPNWHHRWLLSLAVFLGFVGVLLGAAPISIK